jgi:integrase
MSGKVLFPLNPDCSNVSINKGKEKFIYFYYRIGDTRKQIKFKKGLNDEGLSDRQQNQLINNMYADVLTLLKTKVFNGKTFSEKKTKPVIPNFHMAAKAFIDNRKKFLSEKTITNYDLGIVSFKKYLKKVDKSSILLNEIDGELLEDYIIHLKTQISAIYKRPLSRHTIKEYKNILGAILDFWFTKKRVLEYNPMSTVQLGYTLRTSPKVSSSTFTVEELTSIIEYCKLHRKPPYLTFLLMIYYTHLRPVELCRIELKDFDMDRRVINLKAAKSKTRIERTVPLDLPIYEHLVATGIDFNNPALQSKLFFSYGDNCRIAYVGDKMYNHKNMSYSFKTMTKDLGIDNHLNKYHLKHTANVHEVVYENMSFAEVQAKNGHIISKQTETYLRDIKAYYTDKTSIKERVLNFNI